MFRAAFAIAATLILMASVGKAEIARDVFVLSIGSGDYAEAEKPGAYAFPDNDAAYLGARRVAQTFRDGGLVMYCNFWDVTANTCQPLISTQLSTKLQPRLMTAAQWIQCSSSIFPVMVFRRVLGTVCFWHPAT